MTNKDDYPPTLGIFYILLDGSVGFAFHNDGLNVIKESGINPEKTIEMMHSIMQRAWEGESHDETDEAYQKSLDQLEIENLEYDKTH